MNKDHTNFFNKNRIIWLISFCVFPIIVIFVSSLFIGIGCRCYMGQARGNVFFNFSILLWTRILIGFLFSEDKRKLLYYAPFPILTAIILELSIPELSAT